MGKWESHRGTHTGHSTPLSDIHHPGQVYRAFKPGSKNTNGPPFYRTQNGSGSPIYGRITPF